MDWLGIGLVGAGVAWESLRAPSTFSWIFVFAGFLLMLLPERRWPRRTPLDGPLVLLVVMGGLSLLVTPLPETTKPQVMRLWAGLAGFHGLVNWATGHRPRLLLVARGLITLGVLLALVAPVAVDWHQNKPFLFPDALYDQFPLLLPDAVHPNILAGLIVLLLPLPWAWFLSTSQGKVRSKGSPSSMKQIALGTSVLLMGLVLLLTKSRGGYIAGAVGILTALWLSRRHRLALILTVVVVGLGIGLVISMGSPAPEMVEEATDPSTWAFRQRVWRTALWMMRDFAFTGVGMGAFNDVASVLYAFHETQNPGAHNLYLQAGVDLGLPGLIALFATLMLTLWMAGRAITLFEQADEKGLRAMTVGALSSIVAMMTHGLVNLTAWGTRADSVPWLMIGFITTLYLEASK